MDRTTCRQGPLQLWLTTGAQMEAPRLRDYRLAGRDLVTDADLAELAAFEAVRDRSDPVPALPPRRGRAAGPLPKPADAQLVYDGPGWLDNTWRTVRCWSSSSACWLAVQDAGLFWVAADGRSLGQLEPDPSGTWSATVQAALGPALILALAMQGTWCFHAGAVCRSSVHETKSQGAVAFVGESGLGKSTLAAFLGSAGADGWQRVSDDILPVAAHDAQAVALPHFPQLKCAPDEQPSQGVPERLPLLAVYELAPSGEGGISIQPLSHSQATLSLVRHTVAARLFDRTLLARHLDFCAQAARAVPVRRLSFPRGYRHLPQIASRLATDLSASQDT